MSPKHLHRYVGEFADKHNVRKFGTLAQMQLLARGHDPQAAPVSGFDCLMGKRKKKVVEVVRPDYQPTEAEKREDMRTGKSFEELTKAVLSDTEVRQVDKRRSSD